MSAFWTLAVSMLLCNLPQVIMLTQLKLLLLDNGVSGPGAAVMFSALSIGMLAGRFLTGIALDRFSPYPVAFIKLGLPSLGLFIIASSLDAPAVLTIAVFCLGFAFGSEGVIVAFRVARRFGVAIYSSVLGLLTPCRGIAGRCLAEPHAGANGQFQPVPGDRRDSHGDWRKPVAVLRRGEGALPPIG